MLGTTYGDQSSEAAANFFSIMYGNTITTDILGTIKYIINALEENNVPHDYIEFPNSCHGLQNDNKLFAKYIEKMNEYLGSEYAVRLLQQKP
ncbi:hypothetical protein [Virgibacillus salexigens]|uniref:hypothetical protein n=1 Tax=Virgibacillus salexigens TaxID=61016 RepID=UPI001F160A53|nr:hypothetical protein [Virgibacillus salexigens]